MRCTCRTIAVAMCSLIILAGSLTASKAEGRATSYQLDIPAQDLTSALQSFALSSHHKLLYRSQLVQGKQCRSLKGQFTMEEALAALLAGTGLEFEITPASVILIKSNAPEPVGAARDPRDWPLDGAAPITDSSTVRVAQVAVAGGANDSTRGIAAPSDNDIAHEDKKSAEAGGAVLQEVIVTATRRAQNLQNVPISITAIGEAQLKELGAYSFADFARTVPGLTLSDNGQNHAIFTIRGITSDITGGALQSTVGLYIDDLPTLDTYAGLSTPDLHLFDIDRVEVLRGPQGTLFGSGSMGGAIRVITNKPDLTTTSGTGEVGASATDGGAGSYMTNAMINLPLVPGLLALRAVVYGEHDGGWVDNTLRGSNLNSKKLYGGRVSVKYEPINNLDIIGTVTFQNSQPNDGDYYNGVLDGRPVRTVASQEIVSDKFVTYNLVVGYDFSGMRLESSTTYADKTVFSQQDDTVTSQAIFGPDTPPSYINWHDTSGNFFQELHLFSTGDRNFNWFLGAFYRNQGDRLYDFSWIVPGSEAALGSGVTGAPGDNVYSYIDRASTREEALFGEVSYKLTSQLEATVGMRHFQDKYSAVNTSSNYLAGGVVVTPRAFTDDKSTYKFALSYKVTPDATTYVQASQGYRVGGANAPVPAPTPPGFLPDSLWNYELGAKTSWLDGALRVNGAIYFIDWKQMQLTQYTPGVSGYAYVANVGETHSKGAELEVVAALSKALTYTGAAAWNDARLLVDNAAIDAKAGDRVPGVPHFTLSNALQYTIALNARLKGYAHVDQQYVSGSLSQFDPTVSVPMGSFSTVNARFGAIFGSLDLSLYAFNLTNRDAVQTAIGTPASYGQFRLRPRTIGVTLRATF